MYVVPQNRSVPLNEEQSKLWMTLFMSELGKDGPVEASAEQLVKHGIIVDKKDIPFPIAVVLKRLEVMELPIKFSISAMLMFGVLPDRIGGTTTMLVDLLENFEGKMVTLKEISETYPYGFYSEFGLMKRIEEIHEDEMRAETERKIKFSYVYM